MNGQQPYIIVEWVAMNGNWNHSTRSINIISQLIWLWGSNIFISASFFVKVSYFCWELINIHIMSDYKWYWNWNYSLMANDIITVILSLLSFWPHCWSKLALNSSLPIAKNDQKPSTSFTLLKAGYRTDL